jgi:hypothetical protein
VAHGPLAPWLLHGARLQLQQGPTLRHHPDPLGRLDRTAVPAITGRQDRPDPVELPVEPLLHAERLFHDRRGARTALGRVPQGVAGIRQLLRSVTTLETPVEPLNHVHPTTSSSLSVLLSIFRRLSLLLRYPQLPRSRRFFPLYTNFTVVPKAYHGSSL